MTQTVEGIIVLTFVIGIAAYLVVRIQEWVAKPRPPASLSKRLMTAGAILVFMFIAPMFLTQNELDSIWWIHILRFYGLNWWGS